MVFLSVTLFLKSYCFSLYILLKAHGCRFRSYSCRLFPGEHHIISWAFSSYCFTFWTSILFFLVFYFFSILYCALFNIFSLVYFIYIRDFCQVIPCFPYQFLLPYSHSHSSLQDYLFRLVYFIKALF